MPLNISKRQKTNKKRNQIKQNQNQYKANKNLPWSYFFMFYTYLFGLSDLSCGMQDLHCVRWGLSLQWTDSLIVVQGLNCSTAWGILVPWPGIEPASPALQGRFLTTVDHQGSPDPIFLRVAISFLCFPIHWIHSKEFLSSSFTEISLIYNTVLV